MNFWKRSSPKGWEGLVFVLVLLQKELVETFLQIPRRAQLVATDSMHMVNSKLFLDDMVYCKSRGWWQSLKDTLDVSMSHLVRLVRCSCNERIEQ